MTSCLKRGTEKDEEIPFSLDRCFRTVISALYGRNTPVLFWLVLAFVSLLSLSIGLLGGGMMFDEQLDISERQADRIEDLETTINTIMKYIDYSILTTTNKTDICKRNKLFDKGFALK